MCWMPERVKKVTKLYKRAAEKNENGTYDKEQW